MTVIHRIAFGGDGSKSGDAQDRDDLPGGQASHDVSSFLAIKGEACPYGDRRSGGARGDGQR